MSNDQNTSGYKLISALFNNHDNAGKAYNATLKLGYNKEEISVLMSEDTKKKHGNSETDSNDLAIKGAGVGGSLGVATGSIIGAIVAMGTILIISGMSLVIAGPLAIGLAGASAGGIAGGLVGALINLGISEDLANNWAKEIGNGGIMISINAHSVEDYEAIKKEWHDLGGVTLASSI